MRIEPPSAPRGVVNVELLLTQLAGAWLEALEATAGIAEGERGCKRRFARSLVTSRKALAALERYAQEGM